MDKTDFSFHLTDYFAHSLKIEVPSAEVDLIDSGYLDSLSFVELLVHIEQEYGFDVSLEEIDLDDFRTISSISMYIKRHWPNNAGRPYKNEGLDGKNAPRNLSYAA